MTTQLRIRTDEAFSGFAVPDIEDALAFYRDVLGVDAAPAEMGSLELKLGARSVFVYPKPDFEPATYTILNFPVDDIDEAVDAMVERGVAFEHYDGDIATDERGVFRGADQGGGPNIAWFRDPAGNILSIIET